MAIFASGSGSNAENIINYFQDDPNIAVSSIYTNNPKAGVIERAERLNIPSFLFSKNRLGEQTFVDDLRNNHDYLILAGFLLLVPPNLIKRFPNRIINLHPSLLPKFGGKGMYGMNVHEAVIAAGERHSGITIHLVNEEYDKGKHLFQAQLDISKSDTPENLATNIHQLEYQHFPKVIADYINGAG